MMESYRECVDRNMQQKCDCRLWEDSLDQVSSYLIITIEKTSISLNICSGREGVQPVRKRLH